MRLTSHKVSPSLLGKVVRAAARQTSFQEAADSVADLAEFPISARQLGRIAHEIGEELKTRRDQRVQQLQTQSLCPDSLTCPNVAVVQVDGGRLRLRQSDSDSDSGAKQGPGAHGASWREDKCAMLATAFSKTSACDPDPDLPASFRHRETVETLVRDLVKQAAAEDEDREEVNEEVSEVEALECVETKDSSASLTEMAAPENSKKVGHVPQLLVRTYMASICGSEPFGPMVAAEAERRNLSKAPRRAFVADGGAWIWKLRRKWFPTFVGIVDFLHVLSHLSAAAMDAQERWLLLLRWSEACWKGQVAEVIQELRHHREGLDPSTPEAEARIESLRLEEGYFQRNESRMNYPHFRCQGLPITSSHIESTMKIFNRRVKGSEKAWDEEGAETILQLRAAYLGEDESLKKFLSERPSSPFRSYKARNTAKAA